MTRPYRGRLAPTPSGLLHLGHARTFAAAAERAGERNGALVLRIEDLDRDRCRPEFEAAAIEDLRWLGFAWQEGPDVGGPHAPYRQSERLALYGDYWRRLQAAGVIYPSPHSRSDVLAALTAPHEGNEPLFPTTLRAEPGSGADATEPGAMNWRFRVPDGEVIEFVDGQFGKTSRTAGVDFGDFLIWRRDGWPSYELAVVADDLEMQISEVVRGEDLLTSTARQLLIYRALEAEPPEFYHCPLLRDAAGVRLAKRDAVRGIAALRAAGRTPEEVLRSPLTHLEGHLRDC